ncbi:MAG: porin [Sulfurovum sp.]|nr:MAG: porin [Sulfurovum sp.]
MTKISLATVLALGFVSSLSADGVDLKTTGQAVIYYQTSDSFGAGDLFDKAGARANVGLQLNVNGDLGNGFGVGATGIALGTLGLEKNLVSAPMQRADNTATGVGSVISQAYVTKKIDNTTLKFGRQELPLALSPLAFSEDWNVFKNSFDAAVAINTDIQDTTLVGAWVSGGNSHGFANANATNMSQFVDLSGERINGGAYMVTAVNKSIKEAPMTLSYYGLKDLNVLGGESGSAVWGDVQVDAGLPVKIGLQGGQIMPENGLLDTKAFGAKVSGKVDTINLSCAYSSVNNGTIAVENVGTRVKTPLYTQMILNQEFIKKDSDTWNVQASMPVGAGTVSTTYSMSDVSGRDYSELDLVYKTKAMGTDLFMAYVMQDDPDNSNVALKGKNNLVRLWTRYNF